MKLKKSFILYVIISALILTIGAFAYNQIVREQTPVNVDDQKVVPPGTESSLKIENQPVTITGQQIIK